MYFIEKIGILTANYVNLLCVPNLNLAYVPPVDNSDFLGKTYTVTGNISQIIWNAFYESKKAGL